MYVDVNLSLFLGSVRGEQLEGIVEDIIKKVINTLIKTVPDPLIIPQFNITLANQTLAR
nr:unnamed protein product [Callosobruchus analis]CAI5837063.1 unnamed protein product [Callosobruchus analis]